ncbi:succinyldiaminopimelate transaminase [Nitrosococcus watsonii]|uniref:Succinyldiaminopimelate transaminase n=1 Tax=Nitrosococcus watsoni (strain C-113) TaxID=105559 RepID=D8K4T0_NITWC|nr:succinyldiaminopimelate transaminase [Nitrosococcus watsonii]ADJ27907.1 succinyldiaminopimelate transaminase [Nitrosococcus watsonii C-113]
MTNPNLNRLQPYPFQRLAQLIRETTPPPSKPPLALSIGEPKHATPSFIVETLVSHLHGLATYPTTRGMAGLREAIATWLTQRFHLPAGAADPEHHILPVNGTREALFAIAHCVIDSNQDPLVVMPNPFYQIYEGAALLAGAQPYYVNCTADNYFIPDYRAIPKQVWQRCQLLYLCSPGNPTGAVLDLETLAALIELAQRFDFIIAADECYSEIYLDESDPPPGLLQAAIHTGLDDFRRCLVFHSLSKRSNGPGLRSGFVAGDAHLIEQFLRYRTYHGCAMPPATQAASIAAWNDERHVIENRHRYREKFAAVLEILGSEISCSLPKASFYLWPETPIPDTDFAQQLYQRENVLTLPGRFLAREAHGTNPGEQRIRLALVAPLEECVEAAWRIKNFVNAL